MGLVEVGQPDVALFAIIIGKEAIHCGVGGSRVKDQLRPINGLGLVAMVHQPAGRPAAELRVQRITFELAGDLGKLGLILAKIRSSACRSALACSDFPCRDRISMRW